MEKSNGKPASERTPLIQRRDFIDGPRKQQPQTQAMATDATGAMEPPPSAQPEVQNCPDPLSSIQTEAKQIVDLVILAMAKVQQAPPRPSTENLEGNEECEEVTVHTVVPTSAVPASRATRDAHVELQSEISEEQQWIHLRVSETASPRIDGLEQTESQVLGGGQDESPRKRLGQYKRQQVLQKQARRPKGENPPSPDKHQGQQAKGDAQPQIERQNPGEPKRQVRNHVESPGHTQVRRQAAINNQPKRQVQPQDQVKRWTQAKDQAKHQALIQKQALLRAQNLRRKGCQSQAEYQNRVEHWTQAKCEVETERQDNVERHQPGRKAQAEKRVYTERQSNDEYRIQAERRAQAQRRAQNQRLPQAGRGVNVRRRIPKKSGKFGVYSPLYLGRSEIETNNVNTLVDAVLAQLLERPEISELINPLKIEERIPIDDKGNYVSQIVVKGLTSFGRTSDAILAVLDDGSITVEAGMGIKKVDTTLEYQYTVGKCCFAFSGMVGAQLDGATAKIKIKIKGFTPSLISLDVDFGDPKVVKFSGASFAFNWLAKLIVNKVIVSRKEEIRQQIISKASHGLEEILSNLNLLSILRDKSVAF